jgi:hypothetical protein
MNTYGNEFNRNLEIAKNASGSLDKQAEKYA